MKRTFIVLAAAGYALAAISAASLAAAPKPAAKKAHAKAAAAKTNDTKTLTVERDMPRSRETVWRALTQQPLIEEWLTKNDFQPVVGRKFKLSADWGVVDGQDLVAEPNKTLSYTWAAYGLKSVVTWTLTSTSTGTNLRMKQSGFPPDQPQYYQGAKGGWQKYFSALERVVAKIK